jgi:hypothetical protein
MCAQLDQSRYTERAYVAVKATGIRNAHTDLPITIFEVSNQGRSPALRVKHGVYSALCNYPIPEHATLGDDPQPTEQDGSLFPGSPQNFFARAHLLPGDQDLMKQDSRLCSYGVVEYETLGKTHHTQFCFVYGGILPDFAEHCPVHNDSD